MAMKVWLARDIDGDLSIFPHEPYDEVGIWDDDDTDVIGNLPNDVFPEITYDNSPVEAIYEEDVFPDKDDDIDPSLVEIKNHE